MSALAAADIFCHGMIRLNNRNERGQRQLQLLWLNPTAKWTVLMTARTLAVETLSVTHHKMPHKLRVLR